jgi:hypothetical protein
MVSKYIIFECHGGLETPVIFSPVLQHKEMKVSIGKPISAGFCKIKGLDLDGKPIYSVWGESESLKLKCREEDYKILNSFIQYDV